MLYLAFTFMYSGVILSFFSSIYATCVSYTEALGPNTKLYLAFNVMAIGFGQATCKSQLPGLQLVHGVESNPQF